MRCEKTGWNFGNGKYRVQDGMDARGESESFRTNCAKIRKMREIGNKGGTPFCDDWRCGGASRRRFQLRKRGSSVLFGLFEGGVQISGRHVNCDGDWRCAWRREGV